MAITQVNIGSLPDGAGGDTPRSAMVKINANFTDAPNAASRLVGTAIGNVMEVGAFGIGAVNISGTTSTTATSIDDLLQKPNGIYTLANASTWATTNAAHSVYGTAIVASRNSGTTSTAASALILPYGSSTNANAFSVLSKFGSTSPIEQIVYTSKNPIVANTTNAATSGKLVTVLATGELQSIGFSVDANGAIKKASPIVILFADKIELNDEAAQQDITFEKLGVGDYLIKGSTGFAQEGWYIEMPKDANGNVLVAVVYEQLKNNDISIKTYSKMVDKITGDIVPNTKEPKDIPPTRWIDIRLKEIS